MRNCTVSFLGQNGAKHSTQVTAESLFEAAVIGVKAICDQWGEQPGAVSTITVEVRPPVVKHEVTIRQIRIWLEGVTTSPKEKLLKERLKQILPS